MVEHNEIAAAASRLRHQLENVKDHQRSVWLGEGVGLFVAVVTAALGIAMVADNLAHLHVLIRLPILAGLVVLSVWLIRRIARLLRQPLTAEMVAVKVERKFPEIDNRLINSLLLAHEDDEEVMELIAAVVREGNEDATKRDLRAAVPKRRMRLCALAASLAVALMAAYAVLFPNHFTNALARVIAPFVGTPPLTRTKIVDVTPKDHNLLAGDDVTIAAELAGKIPDTCELVYQPEGDDDQMAIMQPAPASGKHEFRCLMADVAKTLTYHVTAGDAKSSTYRITVHHRPVVEKLSLRVTPPSYTGLGPITQQSGTVKALAGSTVELEATCSKDIAKASLEMSNAEKPVAMAAKGKIVSGSFRVMENCTYRILLTDTFGFDNQPAQHDVELIIDEPPEIKLDAPPPTIVVKPDGDVPFHFTVTDRYGVQSVAVVHVTKDEEGKSQDIVLADWTAPQKSEKAVTAGVVGGDKDTYVLPVSRLSLRPGGSAVLVVVAKDWNDVTGPGVTRSRQAVVTILMPQEASDKSREALQKAAMELAQIIQKQRQNIVAGHALIAAETKQEGAIKGEAVGLAASIKLQEEIREASGKLVALMDDKIPMKAVVRGLYEGEMVTAVTQLRAVETAQKPIPALQAAIATETEILYRLTGRSEQLKRAVENSAMRDVFAALEELIRLQTEVRDETAKAAGASQPNKPLADRQDALAKKLEAFKELLAQNAKAMVASDTDVAKQFEEGIKFIDEHGIRQNMLLSGFKLGKGQLAEAVPVQEKVIADLKALEKFLREPIASAASKKLEDLKDTVAEGKDKAERMKDLAAAIKELSEELERSKDLREGKGEKAELPEELKDLEEKLKDAREELAKDLSLFPEIPACNEMAEELQEVFEDIEQAPGSENKEVQEIAVDRDEGALANMEKIEERLADMEMWLPDQPDAERWKQEGWDVNEMPEIPLVDLPEELEDLVGDLLDKSEEMDEQAQDSTSNLTLPDFPAGWDVLDGPMDSFGAKGKSGNERPNANEMMGRSGPGREGNANGEIVGDVAKDLEGRETKVRRTHDPFADGLVKEEDPNSKAKATGGGKQSGAGGEGGLRGSAPARDELAMRELARRQRELRRDTESVYSKASLMYLPTGELDQAIILMHKAEEQAQAGDWAGFGETQKRIAHALQNTQRVAQGKGAVEMDPLRKLPMDIKEQMFDARDEPIPPEFEHLVAEYYKAIAAGAIK